MVDQRALEAACREFKEHLYIAGKTSKDERIAIEAAIEAYEATKWRPIEEMADRKVEHVLICLTDTRNEIYDAFQADDRPVWYFADTDDPFEISHDDLVERGAMFRTIDPPKQDEAQSGVSEGTAAGTGS